MSPKKIKEAVINGESARKIPIGTEYAFNVSTPRQMRQINIPLIAGEPLGKIIDPSAFPIFSDN